MLSAPLLSAGQLEGISASGQAAPRLVSECYCPAKGFLLNGVSPAAALVREDKQAALATLPGSGYPSQICSVGVTEVTSKRRAHSLQPQHL